jgi:hypothetical protein
MVDPGDLKPIAVQYRPKVQRYGFMDVFRRKTLKEKRERREARLWKKITGCGFKPAVWEHETFSDATGKTRRVTRVILLD